MCDERIIRAQSLIRNIPDFPKPGIQFKDITPLLADRQGLEDVISLLAEAAPEDIDLVAGVESRGFIFGSPLALELGVGFVPIRKPGKLPGSVVEEAFDLEYGSSTLAMHTDALEPGQRVLIVDDLLATGGTLGAAVRLVEQLSATAVQVQVVVELAGLGGRENLAESGVNDLFALFELTS